LRVSADPNNMPFTNRKQEGFENKIADVLSRELGCEIEYIWRAQRRGFFREALKEGECDFVLGVPCDSERAFTTVPYYRSSYTFVTRKERNLNLTSFDDPRLAKISIGVQIIGEDRCNTPPAHALALRGIIDNVLGYSVYGDYREEAPPARIVSGVAKGEVDAAVVWGPMAGYFAQRQTPPLALHLVEPDTKHPELRYVYDISLGVKRGNKELRDRLNAVLARRSAEIDAILDSYDVPRLPLEPGKK